MDVKEFKKIDAHAHIGEFGGWAKLSINAEQLIAQMDEFNIEKTLLCSEPNEICLDAVEKYPDRFVGMVYPNPYDGQKAVDMIYDYVQNKGFKGIKAKQADDYELRPAPNNPDRLRPIREQMKTAAKLAEADRVQSAPKK